jgi:hypothetical protein
MKKLIPITLILILSACAQGARLSPEVFDETADQRRKRGVRL